MNALPLMLLLASTPTLPVEAGAKFSAGAASPVGETPWWETVSDPKLRAIVDTALARNLDVAAATARIAIARSIADQSAAPLYPLVTANASMTVVPTNTLGFQFGLSGATNPSGMGGMGGMGSAGGGTASSDLFWRGSATLDARYAIDAWWRQHPAARAARLEAHASTDERDDFAIRLATQVAGAYLDAVAARERLVKLEEQLSTLQKLEELTELRFQRSEASGIDVLQQRQQVAGARARIPDARSQYKLQTRRLLVLLGQSPTEAPPAVSESLPVAGPLPPVGTPADVAHNRPDVRALGARLAAAQKRRAAAFGNHLPTVALTAQAGLQANRRTSWNSQEIYSGGLSISLPVFRGGADVAAVRQASAAINAARRAYGQSILRAVGEVETALVREAEQREALEALEQQAAAAKLAWTESKARYTEGLTPYLTVLTAINALNAAELNLIGARRALIGIRIDLHQALGGAWTRGIAKEGEAS